MYCFRDIDSNYLYVGKSVNLKRRMLSYFLNHENDSRIRRMAYHIRQFEYHRTRSELEALILEDNKIKTYKPDILLVHAGIVFHRHPLVLVDTLRKVRITYPMLKLGVEPRQGLKPYYSRYNIFDSSKEMQDLQLLFFKSVFNPAG